MSVTKISKTVVALDAIKEMLEDILIVNGYNFDPSVRRGWLQHVYQGRHQQQVKFPVIAYRPELSKPNGSATYNHVVTDSITLILDCAVSVKDSATPVDDLLNLMKDVRRALVFDPHGKKLGVSEITFLDCPFDIPEAGDDYAFFSQKISFEVTEQYA